MSRVKERDYKKKLSKAWKRNRRIPTFVVAKTKKAVSYNVNSRMWRKQKLKLKK